MLGMSVSLFFSRVKYLLTTKWQLYFLRRKFYRRITKGIAKVLNFVLYVLSIAPWRNLSVKT